MTNVASQVHTVEGARDALRIGNAAKTAALGVLAHGTRLRALAGRVMDITQSLADAHATGDLDEAECHALALSAVQRGMYDAIDALQKSLNREKAAGRAA
jgi:hypothetical protein